MVPPASVLKALPRKPMLGWVCIDSSEDGVWMYYIMDGSSGSDQFWLIPNSVGQSHEFRRLKSVPEREMPANVMTDAQIEAEITILQRKWDERGDEGMSGSPGEWIIERLGELETEQNRRARTITIDAYDGWTTEQLKKRCRELCRALHEWEMIALNVYEGNFDSLPEDLRKKLLGLQAAYDNID
jgi:hypothetical protein